jgi:hypothetical protein
MGLWQYEDVNPADTIAVSVLTAIDLETSLEDSVCQASCQLLCFKMNPSIQWLYSPNRALASSFEVS